MSELERVLGAVTELTNTIKEKQANGGNARAELRWDDIAAQFSKEIDALVAAQFKAQADAQPQRRVPGDGIPAGGGTDLKGNRYAGMIKNFERDGVHKYGGQTLKPVDLALTYMMMQGQVKHYNAAQGGVLTHPSDDLKAALKALDSTTAGAGDELVPTGLAGQLWEDFFLASRVAGALQRIDMPTNPFDVPLGLGDVTWRKGGENTATTASNPATAKSTLTATELVTEQNWSYTLDEDAVIAMAPAIRARLAQSGGEIMDAFVLNADATATATGNINLDDAQPAADSYYLTDGQDGIRHFWLVDAATPVGLSAGGDALTDADIVSELGAMGKYAADPSRLIMVMDVEAYLGGMLNAATGAPGANVITIDKFGPQAVVLTGQLAAYRGIPIIVSASHPKGEADGKVSTTASNNTLSSLSIVHRDMWYVGFRRNLLIEVDRDIQRRQYVMVTSLREAVGARMRAATDTHTGGIFNIF